MISYRQSDLIDRLAPRHRYIVVGFDTSIVVREIEAYDFSHILKFTSPIVWPKYQGKNQITEEERRNIDAAILNEYRNDLVYIGKQTIVNNDEGEFIEDESAIIEGLKSVIPRVGQVLDDLGYNIVEVTTNDSSLEVNFKVLA